MPSVDISDMAYTLKHDMERIHKNHVSLSMVGDSQLLFDLLPKAAWNTEKRIMIDLRITKDAYNVFEIKMTLLHLELCWRLWMPLPNLKKS